MNTKQLLDKIEYLVEKRSGFIKHGLDVTDINRKLRKLEDQYAKILVEDTSATGGPSGAVSGGAVGSHGVAMANASIAGMGAVVSPQASSLAGSTMGSNFSDHGGTTGSGDVSVPFPVGGKNPMYQKLPMGKSHGSRTGKKSRNKRLSLSQLRNVFSKKQDWTIGSEKKASGKVMNWDSFVRDDLNKVKRIS